MSIMWHNYYILSAIATMLLFALKCDGMDTNVLKHADAVALFETIAAEHQSALAKFETIELTYIREFHEIREFDGVILTVNTTATGSERRKGNWLYCDVKYEQRFPEGNPKGFSESWRKTLVLNQDFLASWTAGTYLADAWELEPPETHSHAVERQILMLRCPLLIKGYGDDNMTFSEFRKYLDRFQDWRIEIEVGDSQSTYTITQYQHPESSIPYKQITVSPEKGFVVESITRFTSTGAVLEHTQINSLEIRPGLWIPQQYETIGYNVEDNAVKGSGSEIKYRSECVVNSVDLPQTLEKSQFTIDSLGTLDGQVFNVQLGSGSQELQIQYQHQLLPRDVYKELYLNP